MRTILSLGATLALMGLGASASAQNANPARFREMFLQLDANGDTVLDRDEIPEAGREAFDRLLKKGDANKNGKLEADEMRDLGKKLAPLANNAGPMFAQRFQKMDADNDGKVTKAEFQGMDANFDRIDADKDGSLSKDEITKFTDSMKPAAAASKGKAKAKAKAKGKTDAEPAKKTDEEVAKPKAPANPAIARRLKQMDADKDGKISKAEFPREKLFDRLDADGDGFLSASELANARKP